MGKIWIDGRSLKDFGITADGSQVFNSAEIEYEKVSVPGRNGDLILPRKRMKNIPVPYKIGITKDFAARAAAARSFLTLGTGYRRIEDSYHPDTFRLGLFAGPIEFDVAFLNHAGETTLVFDCKPQRFLKSGERPFAVSNGDAVINEWHPANPDIIITGNGAADIGVGTSHIHISEIGGSITLDCDTLNAYDGATNKNGAITVTGGWPVLEHGETEVSWSGGIKSVTIIPHWWMP